MLYARLSLVTTYLIYIYPSPAGNHQTVKLLKNVFINVRFNHKISREKKNAMFTILRVFIIYLFYLVTFLMFCYFVVEWRRPSNHSRGSVFEQ